MRKLEKVTGTVFHPSQQQSTARKERVKETTAANFWTGVGTSSVVLAAGCAVVAGMWAYDEALLAGIVMRWGGPYLIAVIAAGLFDFGRSSRMRHMATVWEVHGDRVKALRLIERQQDALQNRDAQVMELRARITWLQNELADEKERRRSRDAELTNITSRKRTAARDPETGVKAIRPLDDDIDSVLQDALSLVAAAAAGNNYGRAGGPLTNRPWGRAKEFLVSAGVGHLVDTRRGQELRITLPNGAPVAEQQLRDHAQKRQQDRTAGIVR